MRLLLPTPGDVPDATFLPSSELRVHGLVGWKVLWQRVPRTAALHLIDDGLHNQAPVVGIRSSGTFVAREQWLEPLPDLLDVVDGPMRNRLIVDRDGVRRWPSA